MPIPSEQRDSHYELLSQLFIRKGVMCMIAQGDSDCMGIPLKYGYTDPGDVPLETILQEVWNQLVSAGYLKSTLCVEQRIFNRLRNLAKKLGLTTYTKELRQSFLDDNEYKVKDKGTGFNKSRSQLHQLLIYRIDSYLTVGKVDFSPNKPLTSLLKTTEPAFVEAYSIYKDTIDHLSKSTKEQYLRFVGYFLDYLAEDKGYQSLENMQKGDVSAFITKVVEEHCHISLSSCLSGLRGFLSLDDLGINNAFYLELPRNVPKRRRIITPLSEEELNQVGETLDDADNGISFRDKAIAEIAIGTGYRGTDILRLTFSSFDWENDRLVIVQQKNGKCLEYPLSASIGNAVVDYLLNERPESDSQYIFLSTKAPRGPITAKVCRRVLQKVLSKSDIILNGRPVGTLLTRHSRATFLLRKGVPLSLIAQSIGHSDNKSVQIYLSTDEEHMVECILPLPGTRGGEA